VHNGTGRAGPILHAVEDRRIDRVYRHTLMMSVALADDIAKQFP
jgi:hypothetical protein